MRRSLLLAAIILLANSSTSRAVTRIEVIERGKAFCYHPWHCYADNLAASCASNYDSEYVVGDHMGLPYDWGGFVSLHQFDLDIQNGEGAGSPAGGDVYYCTTGLDCSGFVSQCWKTPWKYGTATIHEVSHSIDVSQMQAGDAFNAAGYHIVLYSHMLPDGSPLYYEASPPYTGINWLSGWSGVSGFDSIRYDDIEDGGSDLGSFSNPIQINSWPFVDNRDTSQSVNDLLDACGAAPGTNESGPEYVYVFEIDTPGHLVVSVTDGAGVDIDLHLYTDLAERDCLARHDHTLDVQLTECGTYYLVMDTWVNASDIVLEGAYSMTAEFTPSGGACGQLPGYDFEGGPGKPCSYPGDPDLPFCNLNLGVYVCLYSSTDSICSRPCVEDSDCLGDFENGCCAEIDVNEYYCLTSDYCQIEEEPAEEAIEEFGEEPGLDGGGGEDGGLAEEEYNQEEVNYPDEGQDGGLIDDNSPSDDDQDLVPDDQEQTDHSTAQDLDPYHEGSVPPVGPDCSCGATGSGPGEIFLGLFVLLVLLRRNHLKCLLTSS
jgi:hypothetical protein